MKFVKCIILVIAFALADSRPTTEQPSNNLNFTNKINDGVSRILNSYVYKPKQTNLTNEKKAFYNQTSNGILYNATMGFELMGPSKLELPSNDNDNLNMYGYVRSAIMEGYLRDSNRHIITEKFMFNFVVTITAQNESYINYSHFDPNQIKLIVGDYQYKPNEDSQIQKEIETHFKEKCNNFIVEKKEAAAFTRALNLYMFQSISLASNTQDHYYYIDAIPSSNYTLNNVTIYGLWNIRSITMYDAINLEALPKIDMGPVKGYMERNSPSTSEELSFNADNIFISLNNKVHRVNVKISGYSVFNTKLNTPLTDSQSKFIVEEIESAFAASLQPFLKKSR